MARSAITAVLGPTNTGKTHLAVERLCGHASGIMGFPLRLLAREVYDRVVAIKGAKNVGLITGEEKILPEGARWLLCTAESMPVDRDVAFVALDEAQLGVDPERGHIFTDRMLHARGREETMILGSESLKPMVRALVPEAEIVTRPRFSRLSFAGAKKLSKLPPRSAIIAFSAQEVYAIAELIRRSRGGAAVVMGALSPRTRNAQVAMYQAGDVDYLVATDAIGMGLNMDVGHIAFANLSKFDGMRQRRLTVPEMAQIAGRAGRHQRDGTFGTLAGADGFTESEIERIEAHRFKPIDHLFWRNSDLRFDTLTDLIDSLEQTPEEIVLRPAPEAIDLTVLRQLSSEVAVLSRATNAEAVARLWDVCGLPDFRKTGADYHARLVARLYDYRMRDDGHIPAHVIADELARLDNVQGDIDTIAARIASARTWAYAAHRADWLANPGEWIVRTSTLEEKLSDALHARLTERFVDRRTTVLMRQIGDDPGLLDVEVAGDGTVAVEGEAIGKLLGFRFLADPSVKLGERKRLLAAADARLPKELARRAKRLAESPDRAFALVAPLGGAITVHWEGQEVAKLGKGSDWTRPRVIADIAMDRLPAPARAAAIARVETWFAAQMQRLMPPLLEARTFQHHKRTSPPLRAVLAEIVAHGGVLTRDTVAKPLETLPQDDRRALSRVGFIIGALDLFHPMLVKPEVMRWRLALQAVYRGETMPPVPMAGLGLLDQPDLALADAAEQAGYRRFGDQMVRVDLVQRIARALHDQRANASDFAPNRALAVSLGVGDATLRRLMRALGFVPLGEAEANRWRWKGRRPARVEARPDNPAFAALGGLKRSTKR